MWRWAAKALAEEGGSIDCGPNWCTACRLALWRDTSWHASALAAVDRLPTQMLMGGSRYSTNRKRVSRPPLLVLLVGIS